MGEVPADRRQEGYVFSNDPDGARGWRPDVVSARWARARTAARVEASVRPHELRHWPETQWLDAGVPIPTVAARLGHADGTTTMKVYAHRTKRSDGLAASVVGDALSKRPTRPTDTARLE